MPVLYNKELRVNDNTDGNSLEFKPSGMSYDKKVKTVHNLRARITCNDPALKGLLTFVQHEVVKDSHPLFESVAFTNGDKMYFADKFFVLPIPIQCATILHEMFHIVFRHVNRGKKRILDLWNIATDAIINESIGFREDQAMEATQHIYFEKKHFVNLDSLYEEFNIPSHEQKHYNQWTSEELYEFLIKKLEEDLENKLQQKQDQGDQGDQGDSEGDEGESPQGQSGDGQSGSGGINPSLNRQKGSSKSKLGEIEDRIQDLMDRLRDKHKMMAGDDMEPGKGNDAVNEQVNDAVWTRRYNRAKAQSYSSNSSILGRVNADVYKAQIPWHKELRKYLVKRCMPLTENSWQRPSRRLPSLRRAGARTYLPGIQNAKGLDKMMVIIDTSGSCFNEEELSMFCTEIQSIQESTNVEIALIFADTDICSEYIVKADGTPLLDKIKNGLIEAQGGGGTDMVKPFVEGKKKYKPMLTVIASDGYTDFPTAQQVKGTNLLWVINTDVDVPPEAGKALYIHPRDAA